MPCKLIIIRGNSSSGKSTIAMRLQREMGYGTMLIQQDVVRREMLRVKDTQGNPAVQLIGDLAIFGHTIDNDVIIEGILTADRYADMLRHLIDRFDESFVYYFDIPFEETVRRHATKPNAHEFGEEDMRRWWNERDVLDSNNDRMITHDMSEDEIMARMMRDIKGKE